MRFQKYSRRIAVATFTLVTMLASANAQTPAPARPLKSLTVGIGTCVACTMQQAFRYYDEKHQIIQKAGRELGYDLKVRWLEFPTAPEELAAFQSGDVQIGFLATFPLAAQLKRGEPFRILTNNLGYYPWLLMVKKGSGITKLEDLRGKSVGLALGSTAQFAFQNFVYAETGKTVHEAGISLVSQPIPLPTMPRGLAAYVNFSPATLAATENPNSDIEPLFQLAAPPQTGPAYSGPLGKGGGKALPSAQKSPWAPEGFVALRNFFVTRDPFLKEHPDAVKAFVIAHQQAIRALSAMTPTQVAELYPKETWTVMPRKAYEDRAIATDLLYKHRDWVWPGEDSVKILLGESQQMVDIGVLKEPLSVKEVQAAFSAMPILKSAYEATGKYPDTKTFTDSKAADMRGKPVWELDFSAYEKFNVRAGAR